MKELLENFYLFQVINPMPQTRPQTTMICFLVSITLSTKDVSSIRIVANSDQLFKLEGIGTIIIRT
jgi:hypothetical protein